MRSDDWPMSVLLMACDTDDKAAGERYGYVRE